MSLVMGKGASTPSSGENGQRYTLGAQRDQAVPTVKGAILKQYYMVTCVPTSTTRPVGIWK